MNKRMTILILLVGLIFSGSAVSARPASERIQSSQLVEMVQSDNTASIPNTTDTKDKPTQPQQNGAIHIVTTGDDVDDGNCSVNHCTLREAIIVSNNSAGMDFIRFSQTHTILLNSPLPVITDPVAIDGIPNTGGTCATASNYANLRVILTGIFAGVNADGLVFGIGSSGSSVKGLVITQFDRYGIHMRSGANDMNIKCNYIGISNSDAAGFGNGASGIVDSGNNNTIGGTAIADRNVISDNGDAGILVDDASNNLDIRRNYIGTTRDGLAPLGNQWGIYVYGTDATIGWTGSASHNTISGNDTQGIRLDNGSSSNLVLNNYIGVGSDGVTPVPNGNNGILIRSGSADNRIGTVNGHSIIAHNGDNGIRITGDNTLGNAIRYNEIFDNGLLGIDLVAAGDPDGTVTPNDIPDNDTGPNNLQNFPFLSSADHTGRIQGTFFGTSGDTYHIDLYESDNCDASGFGEGQTHLATFDLTAGVGQDTIDETISPAPTVGKYLTAIATAPNDDSSEFSNCIPVVEKIFLVNTMAGNDPNIGDGDCDVDSGTAGEQCTLRAALKEVNALSGGPYKVHFDFGSGGATLNINNPLPPITTPIILDASTNPDALCPEQIFPASLKISLDGSGLPAGTPILTLGAGSAGSEIRGFSIGNGPADGILVESNGNIIACNHIGVDALGIFEQANGDDGISIRGNSNRVGAFNFYADRNVISGNDGAGVAMEAGADDNKVRGNYIGTDAISQGVLANNHGIVITGASSNTIIGGNSEIQQNVISGNDLDGVRIVSGSSNNTIIGNYIGISRSGSFGVGMGNGNSGVSISNAAANIVGTSATGEGNVISGNDEYGVLLSDADNTSIVGNYVGTNSTGSLAVGNTLAGIYVDASVDVLIGGFAQQDGNVISGNERSGIVLINGSIRTQILSNSIGLGASGETIGNDYHGIHLDINTTQTEVAQNLIANNGLDGIRVAPSSTLGEFLTNHIYANGDIPIDLNGDGVSPNDAGDVDGDGNNTQNFPRILSADASTGEITYDLDSISNTDFTIQLFKSDACVSAQDMLHTFSVTTPVGGVATGSVTVTGLSGGEFLTATATREVPGAPGETSEISLCYQVPVPTAIALEQSAISYQPSANWFGLIVVALLVGTVWIAKRHTSV